MGQLYARLRTGKQLESFGRYSHSHPYNRNSNKFHPTQSKTTYSTGCLCILFTLYIIHFREYYVCMYIYMCRDFN